MMLDVPYKKQKSSNTCGAACLEMVFKYYSVDISEEQIATELLVKCKESGRKYIMTADMVDYAIYVGFNSFGDI